jgi:hypothetical protein
MESKSFLVHGEPAVHPHSERFQLLSDLNPERVEGPPEFMDLLSVVGTVCEGAISCRDAGFRTLGDPERDPLLSLANPPGMLSIIDTEPMHEMMAVGGQSMSIPVKTRYIPVFPVFPCNPVFPCP